MQKSEAVFIYPFIENLFLSLSSIVFGSYSAAVSTLLSTAKSFVIVKSRYTRKTMIFFAVAIAVPVSSPIPKDPLDCSL